ncbi:putative regulatory protein, FmdB family [Alkalispirochaeta americana]|uniref:Putative regulatory protein, FmdB family n=1 Tax=Alkalispirochaeta americana TaxID=159291 RepID=A0A1N6SI73_9SPIO|nr:zinc ribbon domain-containing protein [Alkalispirochaeta americana]SIQ40855.1 putative regulatory protein, FmdB family [Alkalispirochaeta americana]
MTYEYQCEKCGNTFDVTASIAEKAAGLEPACPECGSKQTSQLFGGVGILSGAGTSSPGGSFGGGLCGPGRGSGCC